MNDKRLDTSELPHVVIDEIKNISRIAGYLWTREWAERNAGNISVNFTKYFHGYKIANIDEVPCTLPKEMGGMVLLVTGTGCYLRSLIDKIEEAACILKINSEATAYSIIWGGRQKGFKPTSELISHVKIHYENTQNGSGYRAVVHTHPSELIVLSHHPIFKDEKKTNLSLWKMCPEVRVFVPKGVSCTPYALSGSEELADLTIEGLKTRDVVLWEKHGAVATGENVEKAFDFLDVANKGAKLLLMAWAANFEPVGLTHDELKGLEIFL
ncbi:rhamnulose-1-phosphate aldolase [Muricauda sp. SCSIO 64092]|uniref:rhamnulose-1-phosphate aldolase n=1 Tax=Allomuricauda sp. SCSIO 64092 TaxID=2908842 RepID=UPI001FF64C85|nr:rhamnulose-1-phosphate aldolase [Muricauda sp. SCSIO 64092]UOY04926.1 rhamnulose-1-phosphate aldolase [Muricauda sp. SCSIO 64092]